MLGPSLYEIASPEDSVNFPLLRGQPSSLLYSILVLGLHGVQPHGGGWICLCSYGIKGGHYQNIEEWRES